MISRVPLSIFSTKQWQRYKTNQKYFLFLRFFVSFYISEFFAKTHIFRDLSPNQPFQELKPNQCKKLKQDSPLRHLSFQPTSSPIDVWDFTFCNWEAKNKISKIENKKREVRERIKYEVIMIFLLDLNPFFKTMDMDLLRVNSWRCNKSGSLEEKIIIMLKYILKTFSSARWESPGIDLWGFLPSAELILLQVKLIFFAENCKVWYLLQRYYQMINWICIDDMKIR